MKQARKIIALLMLVAAAGGFWYALQSGYFGPIAGSREATKIQIGGPFELVDHWGEKVSDADYKGEYTLIFFGYTFCPDVCPTTLSNISTMLDILGDEAATMNVLFITVDPERDRPEYLKEYLEYFHPAIVGLSGDPNQIKKVAKAYGVYYAKAQQEDSEPDDYFMDHTSLVFLMDRQGEYVAHFSHKTEPDIMAKKIKEHL
jgi:protein SCO1/2